MAINITIANSDIFILKMIPNACKLLLNSDIGNIKLEFVVLTSNQFTVHVYKEPVYRGQTLHVRG